MKQIPAFKTLVIGTALTIVLSSFTLAFDDTPFMRAIMDNPAENEIEANKPVSDISELDKVAAEQMFVKWKSVMMSGINRIEQVRLNAEQKLFQNRRELMELVRSASSDLQKLQTVQNRTSTKNKLKEAGAKLQAALTIMEKMGDAELQNELEKLRQTSENASSELQSLQKK